MDERQEVKSLKKALRALTFLNCHGESTVTEVADAIGVPRTTSYRLLETLAAEGYVEKQPHSHIYRLTSMVQKLSSGFGDCDLVLEVAKPRINQIGGELRWPLALATPVGSDMMVRVITDHDTPFAIDRYFIGFRVPMLRAPAGLCFLAHCDDDQRDSILDLIRRSTADDVDPQIDRELEFRLDQIRRQGYCHIRFPEYREGGLGVPLFADGRVIGGIVMRYIKSTIRAAQIEEHYVPIVQQLANDISLAYANRLVQDQETAGKILDAMPPIPFPLYGRPAPVAAPGSSGLKRAAR
jgi:IclR family mhp operon transcriptional activator